MFQFPEFASCSYVFTAWYVLMHVGFPIRKSQIQMAVTALSGLIASYYVLHRLWLPRHPPCTLSHLTIQPQEVFRMDRLLSLFKSEDKPATKVFSLKNILKLMSGFSPDSNMFITSEEGWNQEHLNVFGVNSKELTFWELLFHHLSGREIRNRFQFNPSL